MMPRLPLPEMHVEISDDEWKMAEIHGRTLFVKVRMLTVVDALGGFHGATVEPFAIVVADEKGNHVIPLPETGYKSDSVGSHEDKRDQTQ
jgi:hypothetical protein